jgi:hypothetical protein
MDQPGKAGLYLCELEKERAERCKAKVYELFGWKAQQQVLHGDAFHTTFDDGDCEILYLNPPYDFDPKHVRLEQKFLSRFTQALRLDGVLVFVVPHYALSASAELLAKEYKDLVCLRFPDPDYATFKQVVVFARRSRRFEPDPVVVARVQAWADSVEGLPILGETSAVYEVKGTMYTTTWKVQELDLHALVAKARPWHQTTREGLLPVPHTLPTTPPESLLWRRYTLATPPRPAHIASGLATGLFNGLRIKPDTDTSGLPDLLVKGTFEREFVPVEDRLDADGVIIGAVEVERPRLSVTCLNLTTGTYQELGTPGNPTLGDLLANYRQSLMAQMRHQCPVLYDPQDPPVVTLKPVRRKLYKAQEHSAKAILKLLEQRETNRSAILLGEIGSGKCLGLGTLVLKYDGTRTPVESIRKGDLLMGPDSKPRKVLNTTKGTGSLYKVVPVTGDSWICNDAHILTLVHTMSDEIFDIPLARYRSGRRLNLRLRNGQTSRRTTHPVEEFKQFFPENGVDFPAQVVTPLVDPYFLGVWYGDGTKFSLNGVSRSVEVTTADQEILSLLSTIASQYNLKVRARKNSNPDNKATTYALTVGNRVTKKPWAHTRGNRPNQLLRQLQVLYKDGFHLPQEYLTGSREVRRAFLAGLLDSDGYRNGPGVFDFIQKKREWSEDVCFLARSLGIRATLRKTRKSAYRGVAGDVYWRVTMSGDFSDLPLRIPRKQGPMRAAVRKNRAGEPSYRRTKHVSRTGIRIGSIGLGEYAGFELSGDGRFLLGDFTVTHNTSTVLAVAKTIAKTVFVMCPPHLLDTWKNEIKANVPEARVRVLKTIDSVNRFAEVVVEKPQLTIAIVSRESAKLGHGWEGVGSACPKCGAATPDTDLARKRAHCEAVEVRAEDSLAKMAVSLAATLSRYAPNHSTVRALLKGRHWSRILTHRVAKASPPAWSGIELESLTEIFDQILINPSEDGIRLFFRLLAAIKNPAEIIPDLVRKTKACIEASPYAYRLDSVERVLGLFLPPNSDLQRFLGFKFWDHDLEAIVSTGVSTVGGRLCWAGGTLFCDDRQTGSVEAALALLDELMSQGKFTMSDPCGEPLFGASAPRRYSLSKYVVRHHPDLFDLLILDEGHEYSKADTAQGSAAHKLIQLGIPTILMTGSLMNGYARSLFMNLWSLSPEFRREFNRSDLPRFVDRYGYRKRLIVEEQGEVVAYGSVSDRVVRGIKMLGDAPGVLPLLLFRHLLPISVTLHKSDLALELPRSELRQVLIDPDPATKAKYDLLVQSLMSQIKKDQFDEKRSGKLFGALAEIPSYLDRATSDTGNTDYGDYEIRYPASIGAELVASAPAIPESARLTKETWLLDTVQQELDEGRRVLVFSWHTCLLPRLARILSEHIMEPVQVLYADKVPTGKRQQWIDTKVVKRDVRVMVANPLTVQTGLNNLVHFATEIWHENPACNPLIFRQAIGRVDRINQTLETRILVPVYRGTMQETVYDLLLHKVATSTATDGVDPSAALMAVGGVEENYSAGLSLGRELWSAWTRGAGASLVQAQREKRSA